MGMKLLAIVIVAFLVVLACNIVGNLLYRRVRGQMESSLAQGDLSGCRAVLESALAKVVLPPLERQFLSLQIASAGSDSAEVERLANNLIESGLNDEEYIRACSSAFYHYIRLEDSEGAKRWYQKLKSIDGFKSRQIERLYDIFVRKGFAYLPRTLEELRQATPERRPALEALVSLMYRNKGDEEKYRFYQNLSERHLAEGMGDQDTSPAG